MKTFRAKLRSLALPSRYAVIGGMVTGIPGAIVGLIVGLNVYPPTAWFAVLEIGIPAGLAGGLFGAFVGALVEWDQDPDDY